MGRVCGTYCGEQKCVQSFDGEARRKQRRDVIGRIILKCIKKKTVWHPLHLCGSGNRHVPDPCQRGFETSGEKF